MLDQVLNGVSMYPVEYMNTFEKKIQKLSTLDCPNTSTNTQIHFFKYSIIFQV